MLAIAAFFFVVPAFGQHTGGTDIRDSVDKKAPAISSPGSKVNTIKKERHNHVVGSDLMLSQKEKMKLQQMKAYTCPDHPHHVTNKPGRCPECGTLLNRTSKEKMKMEIMGDYSCTRHPHVAGKKDSECSECGTVLTPVRKSTTRYTRGATTCVNRARSGKCLGCGTDTLRSPKEKMKMEVMGVCCCEV